jgi:hypothetical protein
VYPDVAFVAADGVDVGEGPVGAGSCLQQFGDLPPGVIVVAGQLEQGSGVVAVGSQGMPARAGAREENFGGSRPGLTAGLAVSGTRLPTGVITNGGGSVPASRGRQLG